MKKLVYTLAVLTLLFAGAYFLLPRILKNNGVSYDSISISLPLNIKIEGFVLEKPNLTLEIKNTDVALQIGPLFSGEFKGDHLMVSGAKVRIKPSSSPFSYSVIPVINFREVSLKEVLIKVENISDTISLNFPNLSIDQLYWNDSITIKRLTHKKGDFDFAFSAKKDLDTLEEKPEPFHIPDGVPKFKVQNLEITDQNVLIHKGDSKTQIANINLELNGWNNAGGADLKLNRLDFLIQDTLSVKMNSRELSVQNYKGAAVHALSIKLPGLDLNISELEMEETKNGKKLHLSLNQSYVSPQLIKLFDKNNSIFKTKASKIYFNGEFSYSADTLSINKLSLNTQRKTNVNIAGHVYRLKKDPVFDLKISPLTLSADELAELITVDIPDPLLHSELKCSLNIKGTASNLHTHGNYVLNNTAFELAANLHQLKNKRLLADLQLKAKEIDLKKLAPKLEKNLVMHNLTVNTSVDFGKLSTSNKISFHLQSDSILYNNESFIHPDLNVSLKNNTTEFWLESAEQNWKISATAYGDLLKSKDIRFTGYAYIEDLGKIVKNYSTGLLSTNFKGQFKRSPDSLMALLELNKLLLTFKNGNKNNFEPSQFKFIKYKSQYTFDIFSGSNEILKTEFSDELISWIKNPVKEKTTLPDFYLRSSFTLDSNLTEQFTGTKIHFDLKNMEISSAHTNVKGKLEVPLITFGPYSIKNLKSNLRYEENEKIADLEIGNILTNFMNIDSLRTYATLQNTDSLSYELSAHLPSLDQRVKLSGAFDLLPQSYHICFSKQNSFQLGAQNWKYIDGEGIFINRETKKVSGSLQLANEEQKINFSDQNETILLELDSINMGPIADIFVKDFEVDARLSLNSSFDQKAKKLALAGGLSQIVLDSISLGTTTFSSTITPSQQNIITSLSSSAWQINLKAQKSMDETEVEMAINKLDLSKLDSVFHLVNSDFELSGQLKGDARIENGKTKRSEGKLQFDKIHFKMKEYGTEVNINDQQINLSDHYIQLKDFTITDVAKNELRLNGKIGLNEEDQNSLSIVSKKFIVFTNDKPNAITKGKLEIESDLKIKGGINNLDISGDCNLLKGGNINHYYKSSVSLNGTNEDVVFINFSEEEEKKFIRKPLKRQFPIHWNVNLNIGTTEVYVLLDKTKQNYVKLFAGGELQLRKGKEMLPNVYGSISSQQGKIYYDLPIVSDVEMTILLAKTQWNGDLKNPVLNFKGVETFRVTPNEMSAELTDKKNRVPVEVTALINNKTLKNFELNFDINSGNADVQNMLSALPRETKESYAINMLLFGKVNNDSKNPTSSMSLVVSKLNEISRRNIKNAELSFNVVKNAEEDVNGNQEANRIGYDFSKGFFHEKFKVSVGGNFDVGATPAASKSSPLGSIQLEYVLKEDPNLTLQLKRENSYRGPINGQVDESSVSFNYNKRFKNLFKSNKSKKLVFEEKQK